MTMIADTNSPATAQFDLIERVGRFFEALAAGQAAARDFERRRLIHDGVLSPEQATRSVFARHFG